MDVADSNSCLVAEPGDAVVVAVMVTAVVTVLIIIITIFTQSFACQKFL
jgi:hypothetical protein